MKAQRRLRLPSGFWQRTSRLATLGLAGLAVVLSAFLILYYVLPQDRSVFIHARTEAARVTLTRATRPIVPHASICMPAPRQRGGAVETSNASEGMCAPREKEYRGRIGLVWPEGTELRLLRRGLGPLEIEAERFTVIDRASARVGSLEINVVPQMRLVIDAKALGRLGAMAFEGRATMGQELSDGNGAVTLDGGYELRETLLGRDRPVLVGSGPLMPGDVVRILNGSGEPIASRNFITPAGADDSGFVMVASAGTASANVILDLTRHGYAPTTIEPRWYDHAAADQLVYALVAVLGVGLALLNLGTGFREIIASQSLGPQTHSDDQKLKIDKLAHAEAETQAVALPISPHDNTA